MRYQFMIAAFIAVISSPAFAGTLKANFPVCVTEDLTKQVFTAAYEKDVEALAWLSEHGCMMSKGGLHVTVLEKDGLVGAYSHVRIFRGSHAVEGWTYSDAIQD